MPKTLSQHAREIVSLFNFPKDEPNKLWAYVEHKCPKCEGIITEYEEYRYMLDFGFCLSCDKRMSEIMEENCPEVGDR
jgi:hypothetical protein